MTVTRGEDVGGNKMFKMVGGDGPKKRNAQLGGRLLLHIKAKPYTEHIVAIDLKHLIFSPIGALE